MTDEAKPAAERRDTLRKVGASKWSSGYQQGRRDARTDARLLAVEEGLADMERDVSAINREVGDVKKEVGDVKAKLATVEASVTSVRKINETQMWVLALIFLAITGNAGLALKIFTKLFP